jgi:hypothetical protein
VRGAGRGRSARVHRGRVDRAAAVLVPRPWDREPDIPGALPVTKVE